MARTGDVREAGEPHGFSRLARRLFVSPSDRRLLQRIEDGLERVERQLRSEAAPASVADPDVVSYLVNAGGKRVRPALALLAAELGEGPTDAVITGAVALELTHVATLYHDDVMDEAELRRSVPSANRLWGNNVAILAGDVLSSRAYMLMANTRPTLMALHASTFSRLVTGQLNETLGPQPGDDPIRHYLQVLADKTGSLIACAAEFGLVLSNGPEEFVEPLRTFGERVGVAFQLVDDVIDVQSSQEELGKQPGTDLREGIPTLPLLLLRQRAESSSEDARTLAQIEADLSSDDTVARALETLSAHPVTVETLARATALSDEAKQALSPLPAGAIRSALERFADFLVNRTS